MTIRDKSQLPHRFNIARSRAWSVLRAALLTMSVVLVGSLHGCAVDPDPGTAPNAVQGSVPESSEETAQQTGTSTSPLQERASSKDPAATAGICLEWECWSPCPGDPPDTYTASDTRRGPACERALALCRAGCESKSTCTRTSAFCTFSD
jgi:hypothetical protein